MSESLNLNISFFPILIIGILTIFLFFLIRFVRKYVIEKRVPFKYLQHFYIIEVLIWILFGLWAVATLFEESLYYRLVLFAIFIIISVWLGWFVVKDFIAGIVFKMNSNYSKGELLKIGETEGYVNKLNFLNIDLRNSEGETIKIPYSKLQNDKFTISNLHERTKVHNFEIEVSKEMALDEMTAKIKKMILQSFGVDLNINPRIIIKSETQDSWVMEIQIYLLNEKFKNIVAENLKTQLSIN